LHWTDQDAVHLAIAAAVAAAVFIALFVGVVQLGLYRAKAESERQAREASPANINAAVNQALDAALKAYGPSSIDAVRKAYAEIMQWLGPVHAFAGPLSHHFAEIKDALDGCAGHARCQTCGGHRSGFPAPKSEPAAAAPTADPGPGGIVVNGPTVWISTPCECPPQERSAADQIEDVRRALVAFVEHWRSANIEDQIRQAQTALNKAPKPKPPEEHKKGAHGH
jgi:hypothetical protein